MLDKEVETQIQRQPLDMLANHAALENMQDIWVVMNSRIGSSRKTMNRTRIHNALLQILVDGGAAFNRRLVQH